MKTEVGSNKAFLDQEFTDSVITHMNQDHVDTLVLYVRAFSRFKEASGAVMKNIDTTGMSIDIDQSDCPVRISFEPVLTNASEVRTRLMSLAAAARQQVD